MADTDNSIQQNLSRMSLSRRRLLGVGTAGLFAALPVAAAASGPTNLVSSLIFGSVAATPLSIGYVPHTFNGTAGEAGSPQVISLAERLRKGDAALARDGARLRVLGFYPDDDPSILATVDSLALDLHFQPFHDASFNIWSFKNGATPRVSSPLVANVPLTAGTGLQLALTYLPTGGLPMTLPLQFAIGRDTGVPKLQKGVYVLVLPSPVVARPNLRNYRLLTANDDNISALRLVRYNSVTGATPSRNPYILLSIS